jgi:hypothetical protein
MRHLRGSQTYFGSGAAFALALGGALPCIKRRHRQLRAANRATEKADVRYAKDEDR